MKLLLLTAGSNASYCIAKTLKENYSNEIILVGTDINEKHLISTSKYLDNFYSVPLITAKDYYKTIIDICVKEKINYILPLLDEDLKLFYPENKDLIENNIKSFGVSKETLKIYKNKEIINKFLKNNGFKIPNIYTFNKIEDNKTYFIKDKNGYGSINTRKILGKELKNINDIEKYLIEERCQSPEYTVECFYYKGHLKTMTRERINSKAGVCSKARIFYSPYFQRIIEDLIKILDAPLYFNLQFMKNNHSQYVITDVNLRLAGGMNMNHTIGWSLPTAIAKIILQKTDKEILNCFPKINEEYIIIRTYEDIITKVNKPIIAFDFDGTLLDSRKRHSFLLKKLLKQYKLNIDVSDLIKFKRNNKNNLDFLISKGVDKTIAKKIQKEWIQNIENIEFLNLDKLYPNSLNILNKYNKFNDLILVTSRANKENLNYQLTYLNLNKYFKKIFVIEPDDTVATKKACILIDNNVNLMIGDTKTDYQAAKIANIPFKHLNHGFHNKNTVYEL